MSSETSIKEHLIKNKRELIEFSVHTKFSSLDGISSPQEYIESSKKMGYKGYVVNDHSTVQSFPEFYSLKKPDDSLSIFYGCEFEVVERDFLNYILNYPNSKALEKKFDEVVYCAFDFETTGLFSSYNEIIEIGYVIWKGNNVKLQESFLVKANCRIPKEIEEITGISEDDLKNALPISDVLKKVRKSWEANSVDIIVAHNAFNFDVPFLKKAWFEVFSEENIPYVFLDTLPLSRLAIPRKKSYSLEKLSNAGKLKKITQEHRSLSDSFLLKDLLEKIIKIGLENGFSSWKDFSSLAFEKKNFPVRGTKVIVIAKNQKGLSRIYDLVKTAHVDNYSKSPILFRDDISRNREDIIVGASGDNESEVLSSFLTSNSKAERERKIAFYDYLEVRSFDCFTHLISSYKISEDNLKDAISSVIKTSKNLGVKVVAVNNVHYCEKIQKKIKDIVIANPAMNQFRHEFYSYATSKGLSDKFYSIPFQHLRSFEEIIDNWLFLDNADLIEEIILKNPEYIASKIEEIEILKSDFDYPFYKNSENELMNFCLKKAKEIFGEKIPNFVSNRMQEEWKIIKKKYISVYWISWKIVSKAKKSGNIVGSRGSVGCSFIAYLLEITDINPLPLHSICTSCKECKLLKDYENSVSCYDFKQFQLCGNCESYSLFYEGHSLPFETFVGWEGEKIPDIDLNFSGEYQKNIHNYIRELLGKENVYRIGTVNKISSQSAENFWEEHLKLRKKIDPNFNLWKWCNDFFSEKNVEKSIFSAKNFAISHLKGIKRTTGQHPGGLLIIPPKRNIIDFTPLNYPADDQKSEWLITHFEYSFLSRVFLKMDVLGHDEPTVLEKLYSLTGVDPMDNKKVSFDDEKIMALFLSGDTIGIPEFGTELVRKNLLEKIKPKKFSQLVQISGFSHGTDVWLQNQFQFYREEKLPIEKLLACREDILELLRSKGIGKKESFVATEFIRKGKWEGLDYKIKEKIKKSMSDEEGSYYFSILEKIKYIFPKPHAIAYTMTAWRTAYYKAYFPEQFYSVIFTHHTSVYDIWLMTFDTDRSIPLRMFSLLDNLESFKNAKKDFISLCKVLLKTSKENKDIRDFCEIIFSTSKNYYELLKLSNDFSKEELEKNYSEIVEERNKEIAEESSKPKKNQRLIENKTKVLEKIKEAYQTISDEGKKQKYDLKIELKQKIEEKVSVKDIFSDWRLTAKEKDLFFTLKIVSEIMKKGYRVSIGVDFNLSDVNNFSFASNKLLIPFLAVSGVGESLSKKIVEYREKNKKITDWKEQLKDILRKNNFEQFIELEKNGMIFT